jgi:hypothetical protein
MHVASTFPPLSDLLEQRLPDDRVRGRGGGRTPHLQHKCRTAPQKVPTGKSFDALESGIYGNFSALQSNRIMKHRKIIEEHVSLLSL